MEPKWLDPDAVEGLLAAAPSANVDRGEASYFLRQLVGHLDTLRPHLERAAESRGQQLLEAHRRVRRQAGATGGATDRVEVQLPPDLLGLYIYLPTRGG